MTALEFPRIRGIALGGIITLALLLRVAGAWGKELWLDELHSAMIAGRDLAEWSVPGSLGGYTPLYFLISVPFSRWGTDFVARIPSIIFGTLTVALGYFYVRRASPWTSRSGSSASVEPSTDLLTALLLACSPALLVFSSFHRMYALYPFCVLGMLYFFESDRPNAGRYFVVASACAFLTFPMACMYSATFFLLGILDKVRRKRSLAGLALVVGIGITYSLSGFIAMKDDYLSRNSATLAGYNTFNSYLFLRFPKFLLGGPFGYEDATLRAFALPLVAVGWCAVAAGLFFAWKGDRRTGHLIVLALLPPILEGALRYVGVNTYLDKSYIPSAPFLLILIAVVLARLPRYPKYIMMATFVLGFLFIDSRFIDPAHPFAMHERRDIVQIPLQQAAEKTVPGWDTDTRLPLVLSEQTFLLGAFRYQSHSSRVRYAPVDLEEQMVIPGPYRDLIRRVMLEDRITFVPRNELPLRALWIERVASPGSTMIAKTPAGFYLTARDLSKSL